MHRLLLTLSTPAENVALDEALLDQAEQGAADCEVLRIWESPVPIVVAGRSTRVEQEIDIAECDRGGIPILGRSSGGASIVAGPGCLMYGVVLSLRLRPELRDITRAHRFVLDRLAGALCERNLAVRCAGTSDLVIANGGTSGTTGSVNGECLTDSSGIATGDRQAARKFSGNSLRVKRTHLLYHGTLLYDFDLSLVGRCLKMPPRQPTYRGQRSHEDFVTNLPIDRGRLIATVDAAFPTIGEFDDVPLGLVQELVANCFR